jgi:hypothetical protein
VDVPKVIEEDTIEYQFVYQLEDLVQDHLTRIVDITVTETTLLGA